MTENPNHLAFRQATERRMRAWARILDAVADMREALSYRISQASPDDLFLKADCQTWCELTQALADFLEVRRTAK
jgi:hypothetical protein